MMPQLVPNDALTIDSFLLDEEGFSIKSLDREESENVDGGVFPWVAAAAALTVVYCADYISKELQTGWDKYHK